VRSTTRAVPAQPLAGVNAFTGNAALDAAFSQVRAAVTRIVRLIGMEFLGPLTRPATLAFNGRDGLQQGLEDRARPEATEGGDFGSGQRCSRNLVDSPDLIYEMQPGHGGKPGDYLFRRHGREQRDEALRHGGMGEDGVTQGGIG